MRVAAYQEVRFIPELGAPRDGLVDLLSWHLSNAFLKPTFAMTATTPMRAEECHPVTIKVAGANGASATRWAKHPGSGRRASLQIIRKRAENEPRVTSRRVRKNRVLQSGADAWPSTGTHSRDEAGRLLMEASLARAMRIATAGRILFLTSFVFLSVSPSILFHAFESAFRAASGPVHKLQR